MFVVRTYYKIFILNLKRSILDQLNLFGFNFAVLFCSQSKGILMDNGNIHCSNGIILCMDCSAYLLDNIVQKALLIFTDKPILGAVFIWIISFLNAICCGAGAYLARTDGAICHHGLCFRSRNRRINIYQ